MTVRSTVLAILIVLGSAATCGASVLDLPPAPLADARLAQATAAPAPREPRLHDGAYDGPGPAGAALRSLLIPGWGQLAIGHQTQAAIFGSLEAGTWASYITFQRQGALRRDSYFQTAAIYAGVDLKDQPENYRKLVGQYRSSDVYNQYVVLREATFFYETPEERQAYIDSRSIPASSAWNWNDDFDAFQRYRAQRRASEQAFKNGQYALGFAVINRLVSAVAAARGAAARRSHANDVGALPASPRAGLALSYAGDARVACVVRF